jgi:hypothetical protein
MKRTWFLKRCFLAQLNFRDVLGLNFEIQIKDKNKHKHIYLQQR